MGSIGIKSNKQSISLSFQYRGMQCRETLKLEPTKANLKYVERLKSEIDRKITLGTFDYVDYFQYSKTKTAKLFINQVSNLTVEDAMKRYIASIHRSLASTTHREYLSSMKQINQALGGLNIEQVTATVIREWMNTLECSHKRINNMLVPLRGMFKDLFEEEMIDKNPMERVRNLKVDRHEPDPFSQAELSRILSNVEPISANLIQFAAWTGLRTGELFALTWGDIDLVEGLCRVNKTISRGVLKNSPKTASGFRTVELLPKAQEALAQQKQFSYLAGEHVFLQHDTMQAFTTDDQLRKRVWLKAMRKSGVTYRPPYQLRHTYASTMLSAGANPMWVASQMGHADWGMIRKIYGKWVQQETSEATRMANIFSEKNEDFSSSTATRKAETS